MEIEISKIVIPAGRRPVKDIDSLASSIREIGLMNPITLNNNHELIAGLHRLKACELLGWQLIPANIIELNGLKAELAEIDENLIRNEYSVLERGEKLSRRKEIYEILHPETKKGIAGGLAGGRGRKKIATPETGVAIILSFVEDTAKKTGKGKSTISEEIQIATNIDKEVKEIIRDTPLADNKTELLKLIGSKKTPKTPEEQKQITKKIASGEAKTVRNAIIQINKEKAVELNKNPLSIPEGKFRTIEIDPPWKMNAEEGKSQVMQYPLMDINQLKNLKDKIDKLADENCHLYLWAINPMLPEAFELMKYWGFEYKTCITWVKSNGFGTGHYYRGQTEHILFSTRGKLDTLRNNQANYFEAPRIKHSEKPDKFYEIAESMSPGPLVRLFARTQREGWTSWGDEV